MAELRPKNIILQAYEIEHEDLNAPCSDLFDRIKIKWDDSKTAADRRLSLSSTSSEEDVLAGLTLTENYAIGIVMRIAPSKEVPTIPDELFQGKTIQLSETHIDETSAFVTVLSTFYFLVTKEFIISTLPHSQIKRLQTYLNWWLSFGGEEKNYKFAPMIKVPEDYKLSEMRELALGEQYVLPKSTSPSFRTGCKIIDVAAEYIREHVSNVPNVEDLIKSNILNARLVISFSRPRKMTEEDYKAQLSSYIKPVTDAEDVKIKLKNGKMLKGKDVLNTKTVSIQRLDPLRISEPDLFHELKEFMRELKK